MTPCSAARRQSAALSWMSACSHEFWQYSGHLFYISNQEFRVSCCCKTFNKCTYCECLWTTASATCGSECCVFLSSAQHPDGHITTQTHSVFVRPPLVTAVNTTNSSEKEEEEDMKRKEEGVMQRTERWLFTLRGKEKTREEDNRETQLQKKPSHLFILPQHRYHQWLPVRTAHQLSWLKMLN